MELIKSWLSWCGAKIYKPSSTFILYVGPVFNVLGCVPLMPLFLRGNYALTIQPVSVTCSTAIPTLLCTRL